MAFNIVHSLQGLSGHIKYIAAVILFQLQSQAFTTLKDDNMTAKSLMVCRCGK